MPFLRVIRDKRGYETTYLMDWHREGERQRSHILYVFRSPGGVRVGREALDPEVRREIEEAYPDVEFDWKAVFKTQQVVEASPPPRRQRKPRPADVEPGVSGGEGPAERSGRTAGATAARQPIPSTIEGTTPDERIAFLSHWYPVLRERVEQRAADQARREALLALTERLNPATWTDAEQITSGLEQAVEALGRLALVLGRRRRRTRRASRGEPPRPEPGGNGPPGLPPPES